MEYLNLFFNDFMGRQKPHYMMPWDENGLFLHTKKVGDLQRNKKLCTLKYSIIL